jgi:hypothetical protein
MANVTVRPMVKRVNHVAGCTNPRKCNCPREFQDGVWEYDIAFVWPSGTPYRRQRKVRLPVGTPKSRAEKWAWSYYEEVVKKGEDALKRKKEEDNAVTVTDFKDEFFRYQLLRDTTKQAASTDYARRSIYKNHVEELFGDVKVKDLMVHHLIELKEYLEEEEYADGTRKNILSVFFTMLKAAMASGRSASCPSTGSGFRRPTLRSPRRSTTRTR